MRTLYLECNMGAAGDMLTAALLELLPDRDGFIRRLNGLGLPGVEYRADIMDKCGIKATHISVMVHGEEEHSHEHEEHTHDGEHQHHHSHRSLHDIEHIVAHLDIPAKVREDVLAVYRLIAEAEGHVHGRPVEEIHFHEVGTMDAIADVTAVCLLLSELAPEYITASPIHTGSGNVRCAHGILPVPAPATAYLLRGLPSYGGEVRGELCTPTGAALLRHFSQSYGPQPVMSVERIGYGCGKKDFDRANVVRAMLGDTYDDGVGAESGADMTAAPTAAGDNAETPARVAELSCNLDDMTAEGIGFAIEQLLEAGALDVYTTPIGMKKCRPGTMLTCLCAQERREDMLRLIFRHTTTLGVRESVYERYTLRRSIETIETEYGPVRVKRASGWGVERTKAEYEDLASIARARDISLRQAQELTEAAYRTACEDNGGR